MTWLVVLGTSPFSYADHRRRVINLAPGLHEDVSEEVQDFVRRAMPHPLLVLGEGSPPELQIRGSDLDPSRGLTPEMLRLPADGSVVLASAFVVDEMNDADGGRPVDFPCTCGARYPSRGALLRHQEMSCKDVLFLAAGATPLSLRDARATDPEPEPEPEPALTDA